MSKKHQPVQQTLAIGHGIDRALSRRLKQGRFSIDARLDLHGLNSVEAREKTIFFIDNMHQNKKRILLAITGKGQGVLRLALPKWLMDVRIRQKIVGIYPARTRDGGSGAYYILLRRKT